MGLAQIPDLSTPLLVENCFNKSPDHDTKPKSTTNSINIRLLRPYILTLLGTSAPQGGSHLQTMTKAPVVPKDQLVLNETSAFRNCDAGHELIRKHLLHDICNEAFSASAVD